VPRIFKIVPYDDLNKYSKDNTKVLAVAEPLDDDGIDLFWKFMS